MATEQIKLLFREAYHWRSTKFNPI